MAIVPNTKYFLRPGHQRVTNVVDAEVRYAELEREDRERDLHARAAHRDMRGLADVRHGAGRGSRLRVRRCLRAQGLIYNAIARAYLLRA